MNRQQTVLVGLSGGVDSSVAAYLLKQQGYRVVGVTMAIWDGKPVVPGKRACYGSDEEEKIREASEVAQQLGIPHQVIDCSVEYNERVLRDFKAEYLAGRTPNPCIRCNQLIKFGLLPLLAEKGGLTYDAFATGHYARVEWDPGRQRFLLKKAKDTVKDQTYFIHRLNQDQLKRILFPLGQLTKPEVRAIALGAGIKAVEKEESQDFFGGDYKDLLEMEPRTGEIVFNNGTVVGQHYGFWNYTIGQRKGLGVAYTEPLYVIRLDPGGNRVVVGTREETMESSFLVNDINWIAIDQLDQPMEVTCKIRSAQRERQATIEREPDGNVKVFFHEPVDAVTPGQSAVFYDDESVVGGGVIIQSLND